MKSAERDGWMGRWEAVTVLVLWLSWKSCFLSWYKFILTKEGRIYKTWRRHL